MQNNVTYLSRKLQRSLDNNYNVIDMPAVIEIISTLEKTSVTKELLETTRLGKYINELRRKTSNESLAKRAKELLKKWRDLILPDANGQIRSSSANSATIDTRAESPCTPKNHSKKRPASSTPPDVNRSTSTSKKMLLNGQNREYDFSDNSNCSIKELKKTDVIFINSDSNSSMPESLNPGDHFEVSNDATDTTTTDASMGACSMQPKKRGRKKGSKNHKNLVIAAEESFTNKMAVSRNSKVKTTQELLADIQNRKPSTQDIELRTAQLTESLTRIEHKLNPQKLKVKGEGKVGHKIAQRGVSSAGGVPGAGVVGLTGSVVSGPSSPEPITVASDDEIVDVVGTDPPVGSTLQVEHPPPGGGGGPLTIENLMGQLPAVDKSCLDAPDDDMPVCVCPTPKVVEIVPAFVEPPQEKITVQIEQPAVKQTSLFAPPSPSPSPVTFFSETAPSSDNDDERTSGARGDDDDAVPCVDDSDCCEENLLCPAKLYLNDKYCLDVVDDLQIAKVAQLHEKYLPNVNGNFGAAASRKNDHVDVNTDVKTNANTSVNTDVNTEVNTNVNIDVDENIVPNFMSERFNKTPNENFQKYSISINDCEGAAGRHRRNTCDSDSDVRTNQADQTDFREWHQTLDVISYNDELLRILPYVIID